LNFFSLGRTAEALRAIIASKSAISLQQGPVDPKFQVEGVAPTNHSSSQKTRLNDLSHGTKITTGFSSVLSQCTRLTDRETDRQTEFSSQDRVCIPRSAVINEDYYYYCDVASVRCKLIFNSLMYSKTTMFAANSLSLLMLLVAAAATVVTATHPTFRKRDTERYVEQPAAASPDKVQTIFCLLNKGTKKLAIALSKLSFL